MEQKKGVREDNNSRDYELSSDVAEEKKESEDNNSRDYELSSDVAEGQKESEDNNSRDYELSSDVAEGQKGIRRIKVTKLPDGVGEETLINYFENVQRNGGGIIECIEYHPETSSAIITFQEAEAVDRVLWKRPLLFLNKQISVEKVEADEEDQTCHTIEVHGFAENTGEEVLENYFENTKRSGGHDVTRVVVFEDGVALVTFADEKVASSLCERQHILGGRKLKVSLHLPKKKSFAVEREETEGSVCNMKELKKQELKRQELKRQELKKQELKRQESKRQEMIIEEELKRQEEMMMMLKKLELKKLELQKQELQKQQFQKQE